MHIGTCSIVYSSLLDSSSSELLCDLFSGDDVMGSDVRVMSSTMKPSDEASSRISATSASFTFSRALRNDEDVDDFLRLLLDRAGSKPD